jgi:hypothetical protein
MRITGNMDLAEIQHAIAAWFAERSESEWDAEIET